MNKQFRYHMSEVPYAINFESIGRFSYQRSQPVFIALLFVTASLFAPNRTLAANLGTETLQVWERYVQEADDRNQMHLAGGEPFLSLDAIPGQAARLRSGEIAVSPAGPDVPVKVPCGLIHDWTGAIFIPGATLNDVLRVVRNYDQYKDVYHPNVVASKPAETGEWEDRFSLLLVNKSHFSKSALDTEYRSSYTRVDDQRWYSVSETTRVQEIAEFGGRSQHTLPEGQGTGLIWRLYSIVRFEERDGGVYVEIEALALSRDIPAALRWFVDPIVRRISRSSLTTSLQQTASATLLGVGDATHTASRSRCSGANCAPAATLVSSFH